MKIFNKDEVKSKNKAKERLKVLLVHDRANFSPRFLEMLKDDLIKVFSKYIELEEKDMDIQFTKTKVDDDSSEMPALVANIPIKKMKKR